MYIKIPFKEEFLSMSLTQIVWMLSPIVDDIGGTKSSLKNPNEFK